MKIIKLDTIDSTNSFLKALWQKENLDNFTTVVAKHQNEGKGQMDKIWLTESGKNLTFSTLITSHISLDYQKYINLAISLAIYQWLKTKNIKDLSIKWPNDIMAGSKKISGILIETFIRGSIIHKTVAGIGININQTKFPKELPNATSLAITCDKEFDLDKILPEILPFIDQYIHYVLDEDFSTLEREYADALFMLNVETQFKDMNSNIFQGKIIGISSTGNLMIQKRDYSTAEFGIKEIKFA